MVTDQLGYTWRIAVRVSMGTAYSSITTAPPGQTNIFVPTSGVVTITNTTPGRDAPVTSLFNQSTNSLEVGAIFRQDRPACELAQSGASFQVSAGPAAGQYCFVRVGNVANPTPNAPDGQSLTPGSTSTMAVSNITYSGEAGTDNILGGVADARAKAVITDLNRGPNWWALGIFSPNNNGEFTDNCEVQTIIAPIEIFLATFAESPACS